MICGTIEEVRGITSGESPALPRLSVGAGIRQTEQVMSAPQHSGDLILPCPLGHSEISTMVPSSLVREASTRSTEQWPQVVLTDMLHFAHV